MPAAGPHAVFRKRLILHDAGLLTEEEEAEQASHAQACPACREIRDAHAAEESAGEEGGGHIPGAMLARWDRVGASVRGLERDLLARHLASCESCRRELAVAGFEPVLPGEADAGPHAEPSRDAGTTRILRIDPRARRRAWLQGALAGGALAAAAAIVLRPSPQAPAPGALPWVVPATTRGAAPETAVRPGTRRLLLAVPTPPVSPEQKAHLTVTGPLGSVVLDATIAPERLQSPTIMVVLFDPDGLDPGLYSVSLLPEGAAEPRILSFRLVNAAP